MPQDEVSDLSLFLDEEEAAPTSGQWAKMYGLGDALPEEEGDE